MAELNNLTNPITAMNQIHQIHLPPTFTVNQAVDFKRNFQEICQNNPDLTRAILDFSQTIFMDSSGLGALVSAKKLAQKQRIELVLRNVSEQVMMVLALADLNKLFVIEEAPSEAEPLPTVHHEIAAEASPSLAESVPVVEAAAPFPKAPAVVKRRLKREDPFITHPSVRSPSKRAMDIAGALVGLTITGLLAVPIAIAITLDDPGPILFSQVRCSRMGRRFKMWKFRSMVINAEAKKHLVQNEASGAIFKASHDPRITRVGRILRKTSLDELPQFWNVLKGDMSLVGTRPPTPDEVERYEIPQWQRLDVKPGMTGEWQVNGRSAIKEFEDIVRLDLQYQENWSLMYDIKLILKTVWILFNKSSGAM
ncbi:sugar transferase [Leptolyngbya sp. AN02str]|uniref:sugar transferase n=1 Tax=Leptolyngbya sp. AN02str TaxID=3423363 RepID=UPI003D30FCEE